MLGKKKKKKRISFADDGGAGDDFPLIFRLICSSLKLEISLISVKIQNVHERNSPRLETQCV